MGKSHAKEKSWRYSNRIGWQRGKEGVLQAENKSNLPVATPADFGGPEGMWTPEDLLAAAVNSCIMTTFLHYRAKAGIDLVAYESVAEEELVYGTEGLQVRQINVYPEVRVDSGADVGEAERVIKQCEEECLISRTLNCTVKVEPMVQLAQAGGDTKDYV